MANPSLDIAKTIWGVTKFVGDDSTSIPRTRKIAFDTYHQFKLAVGCDYYKGRYQVDGNMLRISTLIKVAGDCAETKNDAMFLHALLNVDRYELVNQTIKLLTAKSELVAQLEPATPFDLPAQKARVAKKRPAKKDVRNASVDKTNGKQKSTKKPAKKSIEKVKTEKAKSLVKKTQPKKQTNKKPVVNKPALKKAHAKKVAQTKS